MSDDRIPIGEALAGLSIHPIPEGETVLTAFVLCKLLDAEGDTSWSFRTSESMNLEELLGALEIQTELVRRSLLDLWDVD